jgi:hypothetical protein
MTARIAILMMVRGNCEQTRVRREAGLLAYTRAKYQPPGAWPVAPMYHVWFAKNFRNSVVRLS